MKKYSLYAKLIKCDNGSDIINIMGPVFVKNEGFKFMYSLPFLNCIPFIFKRNIRYFVVMFLLSMILVGVYFTAVQLNHLGNGGKMISLFPVPMIVSIIFTLCMGRFGNILEQRNLKARGFILVFEAVERNTRNFLHFFYSHVTLVPGGVVVKDELCKSVSK